MIAGHEKLLRELGERVRKLREERGLTRLALAEASGLSPRYLATLEAGDGNISVARLADLAQALGTPPAALLGGHGETESRPQSGVIALLGLRGAGKSSVGPLLAKALECPFVEMDQLVEGEAGLPRSNIFEFHGESYYRRLEREALARFLVEKGQSVLATGGGIVTESRSFELLRRNALTVWLKATPRRHWDRVVQQGDMRPMANRDNALSELEALLASREPLYARAAITVDTSGLTTPEVVEEILSSVAGSRS